MRMRLRLRDVSGITRNAKERKKERKKAGVRGMEGG